MSRQRSEEVTFHDVSACFSKEEWKLLHEWQKELYRNVMNEIHQALLSLGPLIATTVLSLSGKEKQELDPVDCHHSERKHGFHNPPSDVITSPDVLFRINREEQLCLKNPQDTDVEKRKDCVGTEEKVSIFIDHLGEEVGESSTDSNTVGHDVVSVCIKDEEETYYMDHQDSRISEIISTLTGDATVKRKVKVGDSVKCAEKNTPFNTVSEEAKQKMLYSSEKGVHYSSQLWSDINQEMDREAATQCESGFSNRANLHFHQGTPKELRSDKYIDSESNPSHNNLFTSQPNIQEKWSLYSSIEHEKTFSKKENIIGLKRTQTGVKTYQCTECEKSFSKKANLFVHRRTHTGERPYHCTICDKSFSQTGVLNRHQRTHTGERPYQCTECKKCFSQKGDLIAHQKKHNHPTDDHPRCKGPKRRIPGAFSVPYPILPRTKPDGQPHQ